jgi:hypothetical protein
MRKHFIAFLCVLFTLVLIRGLAETLNAPPEQGGEGIQEALDRAGVGEEVVLKEGTYVVRQPIYLRKDGQTLRGAGTKTILALADGANCPVVIMGNPMDRAKVPIHDLHVWDLVIDGNRTHQPAELSRSLPDGTPLNNDGIFAWYIDGGSVERVTCRSCRSGGLVTSAGVRRLTVRDFTAYDNQFDGLACCLTEECHFSQLNLHDNLAAGISLDLSFNRNIIDGAVLTGNDVGVFMRQSRSNVFSAVTICRSGHDGVFMAQTGHMTRFGWLLMPDTDCSENTFNNLKVAGCGGKAFQVHDDACTNNVINGGEFSDNVKGGFSQFGAKLDLARDLNVQT